MKNDKSVKTDEFKDFKTKIFFRTVILFSIAALFIFILYAGFIQGHFAEPMISVIEKLSGMDYDYAYNIYQQVFRNNMDLILLAAISVIFFIVFRFYLNWFAKYFMEINRNIDALAEKNPSDITLSPELGAIERKILTIKHTLEERKLNEQLAEQRKNDLIVYLAHDLKTPLASVIGYLNLLHDEKEISDELREKYIDISLNKAERLEDLINEFFEIAKFNLSNITLQLNTISLSRLLEMLVFEFQPMLNDKNLTCKLNIPSDIMLKCDGDKIQRVFDNLLRNAVLYSYENTEININVSEKEENVLIEFINKGSTIPSDELERIFEQFYRLDKSRSSQNGGAGLGLAIAKQIIELHNGKISASSNNEITVFEVTLPLS